MPRGTELSVVERASILAMRGNGMSERKIAQEMGRCVSCIRGFLAHPDTYGTKKRMGRPRRLSPDVELQILDAAYKDNLTAAEIIARLNLNISVRQLQRLLREKRLEQEAAAAIASPPTDSFFASDDEASASSIDVFSFMRRPFDDDDALS
ncbi:hypothetical protein SPRG_00101 [Saprolegnia parasitica CBS 223.65]|uniref:Tc3 transposase DNA binding domain-containing protein n=1 Tax=Saprolegnia parasitica (strain CBS 223.65) TaxID=695850 RepID=A0A067D196_SAPPC|nr:hypothetical protein SPRG_00101 [Saprolegnia parasitica CBS 223.65]KDO35255.1 hypothetical protein SPRG_00101 [Saprolegnia parasitica CBS 223.65]|eukprot:XP_012193606.1 hypothetical protein SPRG_00101 [Saprolegnia parasitica CBS 223.65]